MLLWSDSVFKFASSRSTIVQHHFRGVDHSAASFAATGPVWVGELHCSVASASRSPLELASILDASKVNCGRIMILERGRNHFPPIFRQEVKSLVGVLGFFFRNRYLNGRFPEFWMSAEFAEQVAVRESLFFCGYWVSALATMAFKGFFATLASHSTPSLNPVRLILSA
jgi:hypothetical protein